MLSRINYKINRIFEWVPDPLRLLVGIAMVAPIVFLDEKKHIAWYCCFAFIFLMSRAHYQYGVLKERISNIKYKEPEEKPEKKEFRLVTSYLSSDLKKIEKKKEEAQKKEKDYNLLVIKETCPKCLSVDIEITKKSELAANLICIVCHSKFFVDYELEEAEYISDLD